jgi:hypothetical protein
MGEWAGYLIVFCVASISAILMFLSVTALSEPVAFMKWFTPGYWLTRKLFGTGASRLDVFFASTMGVICFGGLLITSFLLGGWFVTAAFGLWSSPFAILVFP